MSEDTLTQAELFDVFSNARRRRTVEYLRHNGRECDLGPLVEQIAAWENDTTPDQVTRAQRRRVYISLYQTHLPMLADNGIVEWDADNHTISLLPEDETFEPYLDQDIASPRDWDLVYAGLSCIGLVALLGVTLSIGPLTTGPPLVIALLLSCSVLIVAAVQHTARRTNRSQTSSNWLQRG